MERRVFLAGAGVPLAAILTGCTGPEKASQNRPQSDDSEERFLEAGETPESPGAREFLAIVAEETGGRTGFHGGDDTWRIKFSEDSDTWEIRYYGTTLSGNQFREEIAELSTAFASHRPDGVALEATVLHECTTGHWEVRAETAAAYDSEELDRDEFVARVYESVETENNC